MYEATSYDGKTVKGELIYIGFDMFIRFKDSSGTTEIRCIEGTEKELK